jgi:hypothetical protein
MLEVAKAEFVIGSASTTESTSLGEAESTLEVAEAEFVVGTASTAELTSLASCGISKEALSSF